MLGASAETLAVSDDGGLSFVSSVSIPGKLNAFLKLSTGTILVGGTTGAEGIGYRSVDDARSFERWPEAPHVHALAERNGKLYVAADNFADGYAIAVSDDEGATLSPLAGFKDVQGVKSCVRQECADSCAYYADISLWPSAVCGQEPTMVDPPDTIAPPGTTDPGPTTESGGSGGDGGGSGGDTTPAPPDAQRVSGGCTCSLVARHDSEAWSFVLLGASLLLAARSRRAAFFA